MLPRNPAARLEARKSWAGVPGGPSRGLLPVTDVHVPGGVHHRRSLHGIHRGHHLTGKAPPLTSSLPVLGLSFLFCFPFKSISKEKCIILCRHGAKSGLHGDAVVSTLKKAQVQISACSLYTCNDLKL